MKGLKVSIKKDKLETILFVLLLMAFFAFVYRDFNPKPFDMCDSVPFRSSFEETRKTFFSSWGDVLEGGTGAPQSVDAFTLFEGFLTFILKDPGLAQKVYWYSLLPLSYITMYIFIRKIISTRYVRFLASFIYAVNPFTINQFLTGGQLILPFVFLPLVLLFLFNILEEEAGMSGNVFRLVLCVGLSTILHMQSIIFFSPFMIIASLVFMTTRKDRRYTLRILLSLLITFGSSFMFLLPTNFFSPLIYLLGFQVGQQFPYATRLGVGLTSEDILRGIRGSFLRPSSPEDLGVSLVVLVFLIFFAFFVRSKRRVKYLTSFLLIGILYAGFWGLSVMEFTFPLFLLFPPLNVIGSPQKLWPTLVPIFPLVLALLIDEVEEVGIFRKIFKEHPSRRRIFIMFLASLILIPAFTYTIYPKSFSPENPWDIFIPQKHFSKAELPPVYHQVYEWLETHTDYEEEFFRILWLSSKVTLRDLSNFYPSTPAFHSSSSNLSRFILTPFLEGRTREFGLILALIDVKYVVVNMLTTYESTTPHISEQEGYFYASGDPEEFVRLLENQEDLKIVANNTDFVIYENLDFTPSISVYDDFVLIPTFATPKAPAPLFSLIPNAGFEDGNFDDWCQYVQEPWRQRFWKIDNVTSHSGPCSLMGVAMDMDDGFQLSIPVKENTTYYISGWMKIENAKSAHYLVQFLNEEGKMLREVHPQLYTGSGYGTRDWWQFGILATTPPSTTNAKIWCGKGVSFDGKNPAITWFDDLVFMPADLFSSFTATEWSENPGKALFYVSDLLSEISDFDSNTNLILLPSSNTMMERYWNISKVAVYMGGIESEEETEYIDRDMTLLFIFESEVYLSPVSGNWSRLEATTLSNQMALSLTGSGRAELEFFAPRDGYYRTTINMAADGEVSVQTDNSTSIISGTEGKSKWYETSPSYLERGDHTITVDFKGDFMNIDRILVTSSKEGNLRIQDMFDENQSLETKAVRISETKYEVRTKSEKPVYVVLSQSYHDLWKASLEDGTELEHFPFLLYGWANGFYLSEQGEHFIEINFEEQKTRAIQIVVFSSFWLFLIGGTLYTSKSVRYASKRVLKKLIGNVTKC